MIRAATEIEPDLKVKDVAILLGTSPSRVCAFIHAGHLGAYDVSETPGRGRPRWRVTPESLQSFRDSRALRPVRQAKRRRPRRSRSEITEYF